MNDIIQKLAEIDKTVQLIQKKLERPTVDVPQEWFSIKQAATITGLSADHIRRAVVGKTLLSSNVGSDDRPLYRISRGHIEEFMQKRRSGALPVPKQAKQVIAFSRHVRPSRMAKMQEELG